MHAMLALHEVGVGGVGQAVSPAKCQNMFEYVKTARLHELVGHGRFWHDESEDHWVRKIGE